MALQKAVLKFLNFSDAEELTVSLISRVTDFTRL